MLAIHCPGHVQAAGVMPGIGGVAGRGQDELHRRLPRNGPGYRTDLESCNGVCDMPIKFPLTQIAQGCVQGFCRTRAFLVVKAQLAGEAEAGGSG